METTLEPGTLLDQIFQSMITMGDVITVRAIQGYVTAPPPKKYYRIIPVRVAADIPTDATTSIRNVLWEAIRISNLTLANQFLDVANIVVAYGTVQIVSPLDEGAEFATIYQRIRTPSVVTYTNYFAGPTAPGALSYPVQSRDCCLSALLLLGQTSGNLRLNLDLQVLLTTSTTT